MRSFSSNKLIINADQEKFRLAIANIIENIIKYSRNNDEVKLIFTELSDFYMLKIEDSAIRMLPEISRNLVSKFAKSGNIEEANIIGNGLGLYVSKKIIEAHRGSMILYRREFELGTTFLVKIPKRYK